MCSSDLTPTENNLTTNRLRFILFGKPGAGKSTFASSWHPQSNLLIDMEGGTRWLPGKHFIARPSTYSEFTGLVHSLCTEQHDYDVVTIDTGDSLFRLADAEAGQRGGKVAAGLVEYGRGTADRDATIIRDLKRLLATDLGVLLLAHPATAVDEDTEEATERVEPRIDPSNRIRQEIIGLFDSVFYLRKSDHTIVTGGSPRIDTKRRIELPDELPADPRVLAEAIRTAAQPLVAA